MTRNEYVKAWNDFWRLPEVHRLGAEPLSALRRLYWYAQACHVAPPLIGVSSKTGRMILLWIDLDKDIIFDVVVYPDGMAEWYFRECRREIATYANPENRIPWHKIPCGHLDNFIQTIKEDA